MTLLKVKQLPLHNTLQVQTLFTKLAGGTGAGVFNEAKDLNEKKNEDEKVWVIGVDRDQEAEGKYTSKDGKESNFVLASTLKKVGRICSKDLANAKLLMVNSLAVK